MRKTTFADFKAPFALAAMVLAFASHAVVAAQTPQEVTRAYSIPAGTLTEALTEFADRSNIKLVFNADLARGLKSPALHEKLTIDQGLNKLLKGSGLIYRIVDNNTAIIEPKPVSTIPEPQSATTLPPVNVTGKATYDATDPYNPDYVLPNATAGTKTDTPIMETPLNVQVVSKQVMKDQQVITLGDALKNVSGVTTMTNSFDNIGGGITQTIFLRGFSSETFFRDGFRLQQGSASRAMANVESVEVLKGPAAILYGLVEPGGMINVVTKQPLAKPYYALNQQFGSYDLYRTTMDATGPLTKDDTLLYRMNMSYQNSGSFRDFVGKEDVFLAPVLKWNISPRTQATFELEYNHQHLGLDSGFVPLVNGSILNVPRSRNYGEYSPATSETVYGGFNWSHQFNQDWSLKHRFSVNQWHYNLSNTVFPQFSDGVDISRTKLDFGQQSNTYSTSMDLTGHFDTLWLHHTLLVGGDYYRTDLMNNTGSNFDSSTINVLNPIHPGTLFSQPVQSFRKITNQADQYGLYIQDQIKLPYDINVMGGIRYQNIHQVAGTNYADFIGVPPTSSGQSQDAVTPRVGLLWHPQSWLSLYANYVESFGANSGLTFSGNAVPPTSSEQYEGGIKTEFFGGRLRTSLAYYDLTKTNVATSDLAHPGLGFVIATGAVRSRGTELDITGEILPGWNVIATYAYTDARVTKSNDEGPNLTVGSRFYGVPRNTSSLWSTYALQQGELKGFKFGGGVTLRDGQSGCCDTPAISIPGYATVDLLASYTLNVGKTKVTTQLNFNNLLDKHYFTGVNSSAPNSAWADFGAPRTVMGSIGIQY